MSNNNVLNIINITKSYKSNQDKHATNVLKGVSLTVRQGERIGIIGPSGSGKSTFLRLICGLEQPDRGSISMDGLILHSGKISIPPHNRDISFVFQSPALWPHMTIEQNITYPAKDKGDHIAKLLEAFDIAGLSNRYPSQISGGQAKRVAIARALAADRKLLLMDEPLTNLDQDLKQDILSILIHYLERNHTSLIYITHDHDELDYIASQNYSISGGVLVRA